MKNTLFKLSVMAFTFIAGVGITCVTWSVHTSPEIPPLEGVKIRMPSPRRFIALRDQKPTRENFLLEVLYAEASFITPLYNDYTKGSYHVDKLDVLDGLTAMAPMEGVNLRGLIVVGPVDLLWTYYILAFLDEGEVIRVNSLTMPHARITHKSTGTISVKCYDDLLKALLDAKILTTELPPKGACDRCPYPEWHYQALVADWSNGESHVYYARLDEPGIETNVDAFFSQLNTVLSTSRETYPLERQR